MFANVNSPVGWIVFLLSFFKRPSRGFNVGKYICGQSKGPCCLSYRGGAIVKNLFG